MNKLIIGLLGVAVLAAGAIYMFDQQEATSANTFTGEVFNLTCAADENFSFRYADGDTAVMQLTANGATYQLNQARVASGAKYENTTGTIMFWEHQGEVALAIDGTSYDGCIIANQAADSGKESQVQAQPPELIVVTQPTVTAEVSSPILLSGQARGYWFFEGSAPVEILNTDNIIIGEGYITADGDWMTEDFVPFTGEITYQQTDAATNNNAIIVFKRANPSALPENEATHTVAVLLVN